MKTTKQNPINKYDARIKYSIIAISVLTGLLICYYLITRAFPMLIVTEENYGPYYFPRAVWLFPHIVLGIVATLIGPFQFVPQIRKRYLKTHRRMGRIYIISVLLAGTSGMYLATTTALTLVYAVGLFGLGFTWTVSAIMAYISIKNKKIELHKDWMIRSYVITFAFVTFRFVVDILMSAKISSYKELLVLMSWACWALPLFIAEIFIQGNKLKNA